jgi:hypothetical protein
VERKRAQRTEAGYSFSRGPNFFFDTISVLRGSIGFLGCLGADKFLRITKRVAPQPAASFLYFASTRPSPKFLNILNTLADESAAFSRLMRCDT